MVTAGVVIALAAVVEEDTSAAAATAVTELMRPTEGTLHRERALAAPAAPGPRRHMVVHPMVLLMPQPMVLPPTVELLTVAVADRMAVANIASLS
jgi:hypothetical protein